MIIFRVSNHIFQKIVNPMFLSGKGVQSPGRWIIYPVNGSPVIQLADMQNTADCRSLLDRLGPGRNLDFVSGWIVSHKRFFVA